MSEIVLIFHFMIVLFFIAGFFLGLVWNQSMFRISTLVVWEELPYLWY